MSLNFGTFDEQLCGVFQIEKEFDLKTRYILSISAGLYWRDIYSGDLSIRPEPKSQRVTGIQSSPSERLLLSFQLSIFQNPDCREREREIWPFSILMLSQRSTQGTPTKKNHSKHPKKVKRKPLEST